MQIRQTLEILMSLWTEIVFFSMSEKHIKFSSGISLLKETYFPNLILNHKWIIKFKRSPAGDSTGLNHPVAAIIVTTERVSTQHSIVYKSLSAASLSFGHIPKMRCLKMNCFISPSFSVFWLCKYILPAQICYHSYFLFVCFYCTLCLLGS